MSIDQLVNLPSRSQAPSTFIANANAVWPQLNTFATQANALASTMAGIAAGTALAIPYTFSTTTTDADPGAGVIRFDNATQNIATTLRTDLSGSDGNVWTSVLDTFDDSTSAVKGQIMLVKVGDGTKWLTFNVASVASPSGYRNIAVINTGSSTANPFVNGDLIALKFTRTGDQGMPGVLTRRATSIVSSATPSPSAMTDDMFIITALATAPTFASPGGSPAEGQSLLIRIKDNGTARALAWNAIYRASTDLALPTTTVISKTLYVGFAYNAVDAKWDLIAVLNNV